MYKRVQIGAENPAAMGTAVAATRRFYGMANVPVDREPTIPTYSIGQRAKGGQVQIGQLLADPLTLTLEQTYFQTLPFYFGALLKGAQTGVEVTGGQADYLWGFTPSLTATDAIDSFTVEVGDDDQEFEIDYCVARSLNLAGTLGDNGAVSSSLEMFGNEVVKSTFTGALAHFTPEPMFSNMSELWIDSTWATLGTTKKSALLKGWSIDILNGAHPKFLANGVKTFTSHGLGYVGFVASFTFEGGSDAELTYDYFAAGTPKAIRLKVSGSQIGTGAVHSMILDMYGAFTEVIPLDGDDNGNNLYTAVFTDLSDLQATPHNLGVAVTTSINGY